MKRQSREGDEERLHKKQGGRALKRGVTNGQPGHLLTQSKAYSPAEAHHHWSQILEISRIQARLRFSFSKEKKTEGKTHNKQRQQSTNYCNSKNRRQAVSTNKIKTKNRRQPKLRNSKQKLAASRAEAIIIIKLQELKRGERRLHWPDLRNSSDPKDC
ncbi:hypothetical protein M9H77_29798 [Catharanthus roseus]|uniref:Uncharacterized protein n=1 Tax=Catharanthus roseus TaxID=4058 RepID=A0ACB9ZWC5_CATRO|nr:hypothetical protein M9H77_29798 [Catharanthus roseus]